MVDKKQTAFFKTFCGKVEGAKDGDQLLQKQLKSRCEAASFDLEKIVKNQETFTANLAEHAKNYTEAELKILRKGEPIKPELFSKITGHIFDLLLLAARYAPLLQKTARFQDSP
ncbi:hypothetical protein ABIB85_005146 [Bradyrhizobium sp. JR1.5]|uniref:hypothetical protein n=1 Tax=unclassified Bradyrhizobium TaxID=2631580 RepID=UPI00339415CB